MNFSSIKKVVGGFNVTSKPFEKNGNLGSIVLISAMLIAMTLAIYIQAGNQQFLNYDDNIQITSNPHVSSGISRENIIWAFTSVDYYFWYPVTWLSHMADVQIFGMDPRGHHLTNVVIHTVSSVLLLLLLLRLTGSLLPSSFVAFMFALHPLHVESVAWLAERKDVLSAFFCFLTLLIYSEYTRKHKPTLYVLSLISFVLGLMSKQMLVTLPIVMLLLDYWPLNRFHYEDNQGVRQLLGTTLALIREKIPFFACSILSGVITIYSHHKLGALPSINEISFFVRVENALVAYVKYIGKTLWPVDLAVFYPFPLSIPLWQAIGSLVVLLLISFIAIRDRYRHPYIVVGWFWFIVTLVPVIGLIQFGVHAAMADRFSYIPVIGLFIMVAWGVPVLTKDLKHRVSILVLLSSAVIALSAALTWQQLHYWRDTISLFRHTLQVTTDNYVINNYLGTALIANGEVDEAIKEYQVALQLRPNFTEAHFNLGVAFAQKGELGAAINEFQTALWLKPDYLEAHYNLGDVLTRKGEFDAAIRQYQEALRIRPDYTQAHQNMGIALAKKGDLNAAIQKFEYLIQINPDDAQVHYNLERALAQKRMNDEVRK